MKNAGAEKSRAQIFWDSITFRNDVANCALWIIGSLAVVYFLLQRASNLSGQDAAVIGAFSMVFPLIAVSYRRYLVSNHGPAGETIQEDFYLATSATVGLRSATSMTKDELAELHREEYSARAYIMCVIPAVALSIVGWTILLGPRNLVANNSDNAMNAVVSQAMGIGFLGALFFCFQLLWRRLTTEDFKPSIFLRCALALFGGLVFCYVVFSATESFADQFNVAGGEMSGNGALIGYVVAFSLGYFPSLAIRWFTRLANAALGESARASDEQRLSVIDGITIFHEERLGEEGVHTQHDLAYSDVGMLVVKTPYTATQLLKWVDQCSLFLYLDRAEIERFRRGGVRNHSDFINLWAPLFVKPSVTVVATDNPNPQRTKISLLLQSTPERLDCLYSSLSRDRPPTA